MSRAQWARTPLREISSPISALEGAGICRIITLYSTRRQPFSSRAATLVSRVYSSRTCVADGQMMKYQRGGESVFDFTHLDWQNREETFVMVQVLEHQLAVARCALGGEIGIETL